MMDVHGRTTDTASWSLIVAMLGACLLAAYGLGFTISPVRAVAPGVGLAVLWAVMVVGRARDMPRLRVGATAFLQMTLFTILGVVLAYLLAARGGTLWDPALATADRRLGLDWPAILHAADAAPAALWVGGLAYHSLTVQMIVCIVVLTATGRDDALRLAVAAAIASGFATIAIAGLTPAMGNTFDPARYHHLWPSVAWLERGLIAGLRDGSDRVLDLSHLMGIVTFPSYHATLAAILAWAQRDIARWRVAAAAWGGVTVVATPLFGGHYGVDVLAGLALAIVAIAASPWLATRLVDPPGASTIRRRYLPIGGVQEGEASR